MAVPENRVPDRQILVLCTVFAAQRASAAGALLSSRTGRPTRHQAAPHQAPPGGRAHRGRQHLQGSVTLPAPRRPVGEHLAPPPPPQPAKARQDAGAADDAAATCVSGNHTPDPATLLLFTPGTARGRATTRTPRRRTTGPPGPRMCRPLGAESAAPEPATPPETRPSPHGRCAGASDRLRSAAPSLRSVVPARLFSLSVSRVSGLSRLVCDSTFRGGEARAAAVLE